MVCLEVIVLFTPENKPGVWNTAREDSKAMYFPNRFGKALKARGFGKDYSLYSVGSLCNRGFIPWETKGGIE